MIAYETAPALEAIDSAARDGEDLHAFNRERHRAASPRAGAQGGPTTKLRT